MNREDIIEFIVICIGGPIVVTLVLLIVLTPIAYCGAYFTAKQYNEFCHPIRQATVMDALFLDLNTATCNTKINL